MLKRLWLLLVLSCATTAFAQVSVTGSTVRGAGTILASGQFCMGSTCFAVTNGTIAAGSTIAAGTYTVSITNGEGTFYLTAPGISVSGSLDWDTYTISTPYSGVGVPYLACTVSDTYQQTDTGTNWVCATLLGRSVWTVNNHPIPPALHPGIYADNGPPTFTCIAPCAYIQNDAASAAANFWDTQAYPGTATTNWVKQTGQSALVGPFIDLSTFAGADACSKLSLADSTVTGPATFAVYSNMTCSTISPLSAYHNLAIYAALATANGGYITPSTGNKVQCFGAGTLTDNDGGSVFVGSFFKDPFFVANATNGTQDLEIEDCPVQSAYGATLYANAGPGPSIDTRIHHNRLHNTEMMQQQGAAASNPSSGLEISDNNDLWDPNFTGFWGQYGGASLYGSTVDSKFVHNTITGACGGFILFEGIGGSNPTYDQIIAANLNNVLFQGNLFRSLAFGETVNGQVICGSNSAVFVNGGYHIHYDANDVDGDSDLALDCEGCADSHWTGNVVRNDLTAGMGTEFTSINNSFEGNKIIATNGETGILLKNSGGYPAIVTGTSIIGNTYRAENNTTHGTGSANGQWANSGALGTFIYAEAHEKLNVSHNDVTDGVVSYSGAFTGSQLFETNKLSYNSVIPAGFAGLALGNMNDQTSTIAKGNVITTYVSQPNAPCLAGAESNPNGNTVATFEGNTCTGLASGWATDFSLNSGSNHLAPTFVLRNNTLSSGVITPSASYSVAPVVNCTNNFTAAGTAPVIANCSGHN